MFYSTYFATSLEIKTDRATPEDHIDNVDNLSPVLQLKIRFDALHEKAPASFGESWSYFLEMEQAQLLEHLALFTAFSLKAYSTSRDQLYHTDQLAAALGTGPASHVTLNDLGYFNRTAKKHIVSVVEAVKGKDKAENLATMKKGRLAERATADLNGAWLPIGLKQSCDPAYQPMHDMEDVDYDDQDAADENFDEGE